jgi:N-acyl-D-amino-acid deacylase
MLLKNGTIIDGTGRRGSRADLRIEGDTIVAVGKLTPNPSETVIVLEKNSIVAPGFIDAHSHADLCRL